MRETVEFDSRYIREQDKTLPKCIICDLDGMNSACIKPFRLIKRVYINL